MRTPCYSVKRTDSSVPLVPALCKIHCIMRTLACLSPKFVHHRWSIQQLDITISLVCTVITTGQPFSQAYGKGELYRTCLRSAHALPRLPKIHRGRMRKGKALPAIEIDERPFGIPAKWRWVKFGNIADFSAGRIPTRNELSFWNTGDYPWISISDMNDGETVYSVECMAKPRLWYWNMFLWWNGDLQ